MRKKNTIQNVLYNNMRKCEKVVTYTKGPLGQDNERSCVVICGVPFDDNAAFYKELSLIVIVNNWCKKILLKPGYNPQVSLLNFSGSGNDIYVTIDSGGSGGFQFFYIFKYYRCSMHLLMSDDLFNAKYNNYTGSYRDYYKAQVACGSDVWQIELSCKGTEYLSQIYNMNGTLISPRNIYISGANYTYPQYNQSTDKYTLIVYQSISGLYQADSLGYLETTLSFDENDYMVDNIYLKTQNDEANNCIMT